jgi:hypothetical protein
MRGVFVDWRGEMFFVHDDDDGDGGGFCFFARFAVGRWREF